MVRARPKGLARCRGDNLLLVPEMTVVELVSGLLVSGRFCVHKRRAEDLSNALCVHKDETGALARSAEACRRPGRNVYTNVPHSDATPLVYTSGAIVYPDRICVHKSARLTPPARRLCTQKRPETSKPETSKPETSSPACGFPEFSCVA